MKLLANENFPFKSVLYLRGKGFDISAIGTDNPGLTDSQVVDIAIAEERTILTFDRDYGELVFKHNFRPPLGIIYIRLSEYLPEDPGKLIEELINSKDFNFGNAFTVVDKHAIRQRKYSP